MKRRENGRRAFIMPLDTVLASVDAVGSVTSSSIAAPTDGLFTARPVEWRIPIGCDFSGFFVEVALGYIPILKPRIAELYLLQTRCSEEFLSLLKPDEADAYLSAQVADHDRTVAETAASIVIEHGNPCLMRTFARRPFHVIARVMSEGALAPDQLQCALAADELWVPSDWHVGIFRGQGIPANMLTVVPEYVDGALFRPRADRADHAASATSARRPSVRGARFVSVFKWERRKGWDVLLSAYWSEFGRREGTLLRLRTYVPSWEAGPRRVEEWMVNSARQFGRPLDALPRVEVLPELSRAALADEYAASDAFVLPSRGEGWCLPCVEAMSAGLPIIVTNHSGPTSFLTDENSLPVKVASVDAALQAEPSVAHVRERMRFVASDAERARAIGQRARADILERFSARRVGDVALARLREIAGA